VAKSCSAVSTANISGLDFNPAQGRKGGVMQKAFIREELGFVEGIYWFYCC
jgi:hypothetical protein